MKAHGKPMGSENDPARRWEQSDFPNDKDVIRRDLAVSVQAS
jgi:hypothetical protein